MNDKGLITLSLLRNEAYRASGTYTIIRDETSSPIEPVNPVVCLIPGFSKDGMFNAPVYIEKGDYSTFTQLFGEEDKILQRKGSWFHLAALTALQEGPILALNLLSLNNEVDADGVPTVDADVVEYRSFSTDIASLNGDNDSKLYSSYFNKERFWKADPEYLLATRSIGDKKSIFNITNLSKSQMSFIIKKSSVKGFDISAKEWYGDTELIPKFIKQDDLISDYFVDVIAIRGNYGPENYNSLAADTLFGNYFTSAGLIASKIDEFLALNEVNVVDIFTGSIIPNFVDKDNSTLFIETIINNQATRYGILCAIDKDELDLFDTGENTKNIDLIGHSLIGHTVTDTDFLSYKKRLVQDFTYTQKTTNSSYKMNHNYGYSKVDAPGKITVTITPTNPDFDLLSDNLAVGMNFAGERTAAGATAGITILIPVLEISRISKSASQLVFDLRSPFKDLETATSGSFVNLKTTATTNYTNVPTAFVNTDTIDVIIDIDGTPTTIGTYTWSGLSTIAAMVADLAADVNLNTGTTKVSAINNSPTLHLEYTGTGTPIAFYIAVNAGSSGPSYNITETTNKGLTYFTNGATLVSSTFEIEKNRIIIDSTSSFYIFDTDSQPFLDWKTGSITNGDKIKSSGDTFYIKFTETRAEGGTDTIDDYRKILTATLFTDADLTIPASPASAIAFGSFIDSSGFSVGASKMNIISLSDAINLRIPATIIDTKVARVEISYESKVKVGQYLVGLDENNDAILARIVSIKRYGVSSTPTHIDITTNIPVKEFTNISLETEIERFYSIEEIYTSFDLTYLPGFTLKSTHMPNGTNSRMKEIYNVITETNIGDSLADPEMTNFRYLVDTFNHGLEPASKNYLSKFLLRRRKSLGILNTPTVKEFKDSTNPRFTKTPTAIDPAPTLSTKFIVSGGNLDENPEFLYTLPTENDGASYVGYFFPNFSVRTSSGELISPPPSPFVSNNFVRKWADNPFKPVAGPNRGIVSGTGLAGLTYSLDREMRGDLETMGINPIFRKQNGDFQINGNETAYKKFRSILNNLNVRDTLITIESDTESIVSGFEFDYSDDTLRTTIVSALKKYYGDLRDVYGAISVFEIKFDRQNNPSWVTSEGASVIDVKLEFPDISKRFFNRITLSRGNKPVVGNFVAV